MAAAAADELKRQGGGFTIVRYTVPGIKDLPAACKILFDEQQGTAVVLQELPTAEDMDAGAKVMSAMDPKDTPGTRTTSRVPLDPGRSWSPLQRPPYLLPCLPAGARPLTCRR